jgi:hypothetical protein
VRDNRRLSLSRRQCDYHYQPSLRSRETAGCRRECEEHHMWDVSAALQLIFEVRQVGSEPVESLCLAGVISTAARLHLRELVL